MEASKETLYFAYGSNTNMRQMAYRCRGAKIIGRAKLHGFRLAYRRSYLTVLCRKDALTEGVVWSLRAKHVKALDRYEGYPLFYNKHIVSVDLEDGKKVDALIYIAQPEFDRDYTLPSQRYIDTCTGGYKDCGVDNRQLEEAFKDICEIRQQ